MFKNIGPGKALGLGERSNRRLKKITHFRDLCLQSLPTVTRLMKSRTMRWVRHAARVGDEQNTDGITKEIDFEGVAWTDRAEKWNSLRTIMNIVHNVRNFSAR